MERRALPARRYARNDGVIVPTKERRKTLKNKEKASNRDGLGLLFLAKEQCFNTMHQF